MLGVNMTFISSSEVKKCIFHECRRHELNIHFFTSRDEISHIHDKHLNFLFIIYITFDRRDANLAFARESRRRRHDVHVLFGDVRYDVRNAHWPVNNKIKRKFTLFQ